MTLKAMMTQSVEWWPAAEHKDKILIRSAEIFLFTTTSSNGYGSHLTFYPDALSFCGTKLVHEEAEPLLHLVLRLGMHGALPSHPVYTFTTCVKNRDNFTFTFATGNIKPFLHYSLYMVTSVIKNYTLKTKNCWYNYFIWWGGKAISKIC
jgi:hypothetical protein